MKKERLLENSQKLSSLAGQPQSQTSEPSCCRRQTVKWANTTVRPYELIANAQIKTVFCRSELHVFCPESSTSRTWALRPLEQPADLLNAQKLDFAVAPSSFKPVIHASSLEPVLKSSSLEPVLKSSSLEGHP